MRCPVNHDFRGKFNLFLVGTLHLEWRWKPPSHLFWFHMAGFCSMFFLIFVLRFMSQPLGWTPWVFLHISTGSGPRVPENSGYILVNCASTFLLWKGASPCKLWDSCIYLMLFIHDITALIVEASPINIIVNIMIINRITDGFHVGYIYIYPIDTHWQWYTVTTYVSMISQQTNIS